MNPLDLKFVPDTRGPSLWCRFVHREWWLSNDLGVWWTSKRTTYEIKCLKCGRCWTWTHPVTGRRQ